MNQIQLVQIYPNKIPKHGTDPTKETIAASLISLLTNSCELPRVSSWKMQPYRVGTIVVKDNIEDLDFRGTNAASKVNKVDCLAVWFLNSTSYPANKFDEVHLRKYLNETFANCESFYKIPNIFEALIIGVEQQLVRRVVAIGQEIEKKNEPPIPPEYLQRWLSVPKNRIPPHLRK